MAQVLVRRAPGVGIEIFSRSPTLSDEEPLPEKYSGLLEEMHVSRVTSGIRLL